MSEVKVCTYDDDSSISISVKDFLECREILDNWERSVDFPTYIVFDGTCVMNGGEITEAGWKWLSDDKDE